MSTKQWRRSWIFLFVLTFLLCLFLSPVRAATECQSAFTDVASKALSADIVFDGTVYSVSSRDRFGIYNATFLVRNVLRAGVDQLAIDRQHGLYKRIKVRPFSDVANPTDCVASVGLQQRKIIYLNPPYRTGDGDQEVYTLSGMPDNPTPENLELIRNTVCQGCAKVARGRITPNEVTVQAGKKFQLKCKGRGKPEPTVIWIREGAVLHPDGEVKIKNGKRSSRVVVRRARQVHAGIYQCRTENVLGANVRDVMVRVEGDIPPPRTRSPPSWTPPTPSISGPNLGSLTVPRATPLPWVPPTARVVTNSNYMKACKDQSYCLNGGQCYDLPELGEKICRCTKDRVGARCEYNTVLDIISELRSRDAHQFDRTMTITGLVIMGLIVIGVCIVAYCMARRKREDFYRKKALRLQKRQKPSGDSGTFGGKQDPRTNKYEPPGFINKHDSPCLPIKPICVSVKTQTPPLAHMEALPMIHNRSSDGQSRQNPYAGMADSNGDPFPKVHVPSVNQPPTNNTSTVSAVIEQHPPQAHDDFAAPPSYDGFPLCNNNKPYQQQPANQQPPYTNGPITIVRPPSPDGQSQHSDYDNNVKVIVDVDSGKNGAVTNIVDGGGAYQEEPTHILSYAPSSVTSSSSSCSEEVGSEAGSNQVGSDSSSEPTSGPDSVVDSEDEEDEQSGDQSDQNERALFERLIANPRVVTPRSGSLSSEHFEQQVLNPSSKQHNHTNNIAATHNIAGGKEQHIPTTGGQHNATTHSSSVNGSLYRGSKPGSITSLTSLTGSPWEGFTLPPSLNNDTGLPDAPATLPASYRNHYKENGGSDVISANKYLLYDGVANADQLKEGESLIEKLQRLNDDPESTVV